MYQAIDLYLEMLTEDNTVMKFISKNKDLSTQELLKVVSAISNNRIWGFSVHRAD